MDRPLVRGTLVRFLPFLPHRFSSADSLSREFHAPRPLDYSPLKRRNVRISELKLRHQNYSIDSMPQWVNFETSFVCNLMCPHCETHGTEETRRIFNNKNLNMPRETLSRVAAQALPWADEFSLSLTGEPLATTGLGEVLGELGQYGARLYLVTNGTFFSQDMLLKLIPIVGSIQISIDGATELTCEAIRLGVKFEKLLKNIRLLTRCYELLPAPWKPQISIAYTIMGSNIRDLPEMVRLARALGVPAINGCFVVVEASKHVQREAVEFYKPLYNAYYQRARKMAVELGISLHLPDPFPGVESDADMPTCREGMIVKEIPEGYYESLPPPESLLDEDAINAEAAEIIKRLRGGASPEFPREGQTAIPIKKESRWQSLPKLVAYYRLLLRDRLRRPGRKIKCCEYLDRRMYVSSGGDVIPCCIHGRPVLGNVHRNTVAEIWNGPAYNEFRRRFHSSDPFDCCKGCIHVRYRST